jgi:hypothetical protein
LGSQPGRLVRIGAGLTLIVVGVVLGGGWLAVAVVGLLPLAAGVSDFCIFGPLFRLPFTGRRFREETAHR